MLHLLFQVQLVHSPFLVLEKNLMLAFGELDLKMPLKLRRWGDLGEAL